MYLGKLMEIASKQELYHNPMNPYTQALLSAIPSVDPTSRKQRIILEGDVPSPIDPPPGCRFCSRCFKRIACCDRIDPKLQELSPGHFVACNLYDEEAKQAVPEAKTAV